MLSNQGPWSETCPASPAPLIFCAVPVTEQTVMWRNTSMLQLGQLHIVLRCCSIVVRVSPGVTLFPTGYYELHFATSFCHASKRPGLKHLLLPKGEVRCKLLHQERRSLENRGVMWNQMYVSCLRSRMRRRSTELVPLEVWMSLWRVMEWDMHIYVSSKAEGQPIEEWRRRLVWRMNMC
jgi:hypothetical protein